MGDHGILQSNLTQALSMLGYRCYHESSELAEAQFAKLMKGDRSFRFDAIIGVGVLGDFISDLAHRYPEARFIVTEENLRRSSPAETSPMVTLCSGRRTVSANAETLAKQVAAVGAKFMIIWSASDANWSNLCTFLGCGVPFAPYPALPKAVLKFPLDHGNGEPLGFRKPSSSSLIQRLGSCPDLRVGKGSDWSNATLPRRTRMLLCPAKYNLLTARIGSD